jgi:hypothetical protein
MCVVRSLLKRKFMIPGGSAPEMEVSYRLIEYAKTLSGVSCGWLIYISLYIDSIHTSVHVYDSSSMPRPCNVCVCLCSVISIYISIYMYGCMCVCVCVCVCGSCSHRLMSVEYSNVAAELVGSVE